MEADKGDTAPKPKDSKSKTCHCGLQARLSTSNDAPRRFWCCSKANETCDFFEWERIEVKSSGSNHSPNEQYTPQTRPNNDSPHRQHSNNGSNLANNSMDGSGLGMMGVNHYGPREESQTNYAIHIHNNERGYPHDHPYRHRLPPPNISGIPPGHQSLPSQAPNEELHRRPMQWNNNIQETDSTPSFTGSAQEYHAGSAAPPSGYFPRDRSFYATQGYDVLWERGIPVPYVVRDIDYRYDKLWSVASPVDFDDRNIPRNEQRRQGRRDNGLRGPGTIAYGTYVSPSMMNAQGSPSPAAPESDNRRGPLMTCICCPGGR